MVINLTVSEKSTFFRFLALYLGSSFILMLIITFFYFENEKKLYFDLIKSNMENTVSKISSKIIFAHMTGSELNTKDILLSNEYKISFYNKEKKIIFGNLEDKIDFTKKIMQHDEKHFILIDTSTLGHLGVYYIAIEENLFFKKIKKLKVDITLFFLLIYSFIALIGYYLAKMFLKPIRKERKRLNDFIRDTTHELNTPISAILMSSESTELSEKQIERIRLSATRVSEIYKDLTYIFLQNKDERTKVSLVKLDEVIMEQLKYFEALALKKKIKINSSLEKFEFNINKDDFIRLVNNLISNAIKYNKISGEINISLCNRELIIVDTGMGIEKKKIKDIYKRYYRATSEQGGFGIGLNIVSHVCKKYNIKIDVYSNEKKGTKFILKF